MIGFVHLFNYAALELAYKTKHGGEVLDDFPIANDLQAMYDNGRVLMIYVPTPGMLIENEMPIAWFRGKQANGWDYLKEQRAARSRVYACLNEIRQTGNFACVHQ